MRRVRRSPRRSAISPKSSRADSTSKRRRHEWQAQRSRKPHRHRSSARGGDHGDAWQCRGPVRAKRADGSTASVPMPWSSARQSVRRSPSLRNPIRSRTNLKSRRGMSSSCFPPSRVLPAHSMSGFWTPQSAI